MIFRVCTVGCGQSECSLLFSLIAIFSFLIFGGVGIVLNHKFLLSVPKKKMTSIPKAMSEWIEKKNSNTST